MARRMRANNRDRAGLVVVSRDGFGGSESLPDDDGPPRLVQALPDAEMLERMEQRIVDRLVRRCRRAFVCVAVSSSCVCNCVLVHERRAIGPPVCSCMHVHVVSSPLSCRVCVCC
jgi:hypothetical protein